LAVRTGQHRDRRLVPITARRGESLGEPFRDLCLGIRELSERFTGDGVHFLHPVHLNPNVHRPVGALLSGCSNRSITCRWYR
jgi:UDP-N-acetylglucosamine 2-epimerase